MDLSQTGSPSTLVGDGASKRREQDRRIGSAEDVQWRQYAGLHRL